MSDAYWRKHILKTKVFHSPLFTLGYIDTIIDGVNLFNKVLIDFVVNDFDISVTARFVAYNIATLKYNFNVHKDFNELYGSKVVKRYQKRLMQF